ncbi:MAG: hypothetical protein AAGA96_11810 [Verrucomicrobiota bacterium]
MSTEENKIADPPLYPQADQFLSEEDLDLKNLSWEELLAVWEDWLKQASSTDEMDAHLYSHGVFQTEPT